MDIQTKFGRAIVKLRRERGISQERFAFDSGIARKYFSDIENGKRNISLDIIERIANQFEMPISELMKRAEEYKEE